MVPLINIMREKNAKLKISQEFTNVDIIFRLFYHFYQRMNKYYQNINMWVKTI